LADEKHLPRSIWASRAAAELAQVAAIRQPGEHMNKPLHIQLPADSAGEGTRG